VCRWIHYLADQTAVFVVQATSAYAAAKVLIQKQSLLQSPLMIPDHPLEDCFEDGGAAVTQGIVVAETCCNLQHLRVLQTSVFLGSIAVRIVLLQPLFHNIAEIAFRGVREWSSSTTTTTTMFLQPLDEPS
jgi:hypothetical protein